MDDKRWKRERRSDESDCREREHWKVHLHWNGSGESLAQNEEKSKYRFSRKLMQQALPAPLELLRSLQAKHFPKQRVYDFV